MTAPFSPRVTTQLASEIRHEFRAWAVPRSGPEFALDVTDPEITFSEDWAPYIQARLDCSIPNQAQLDKLDARYACRVRLEAGYTFPDGVAEIFHLANLGLRNRGVRRPANTMALEAASDEAVLQDYTWFTQYPLMAVNGINEAISWCLEFGTIPFGYSLSSAAPGANYRAAMLADLAHNPGDSLWSLVDDAAGRTDMRVYCDENNIWRVAYRPEIAGTPAYSLTVGEAGTIIESDTRLSREDWYNRVALTYTWRDGAGTEQAVYGNAAASGALSGGNVGYKTYTKTYNRPISQAQANAVAATKLRTLLSRGRSLTLSAHAAYWLRPGMTIQVTLPTGAPEKHLIQSVTFRPAVGLMSITTRQPDNVEIVTGE